MGYKQYFVYILTNRWRTVLYTGMTNSLERRIWQHKNGTLRGFTKKYNCNRLIYYETFDEVEQAISREKPNQALEAREEGRVDRLNESGMERPRGRLVSERAAHI